MISGKTLLEQVSTVLNGLTIHASQARPLVNAAEMLATAYSHFSKLEEEIEALKKEIEDLKKSVPTNDSISDA